MVKFYQKMGVLGSKRFAPISRGHFWAQNGVFELFGALEPPNSALRGPILLVHGNSGQKMSKIIRVFGLKKMLSRAL